MGRNRISAGPKGTGSPTLSKSSVSVKPFISQMALEQRSNYLRAHLARVQVLTERVLQSGSWTLSVVPWKEPRGVPLPLG